MFLVEYFDCNEIKNSEKRIFKDSHIQLVKDSFDVETVNSNYFTVLIGNNGTGKSILLSAIAKKYRDTNYNKDYSRYPSKTIALSSTMADKFPQDISNRFKIDTIYGNSKYEKMDYIYLGQRSRNNFYSSVSQFNKAIDILIENYADERDSTELRHIFEYLDYEPIVKMVYTINDKTTLSRRNTDIRMFIDEKMNELYSSKNIDDTLEKYGVSVGDLHYFLTSRINSNDELKYELIINFSEKNIDRVKNDNSLFMDNANVYKYLELLKKVGFFRTQSIKLFKKDGQQVDFRQTSSGETAILSTLMALVPLIEDNCLILIDEPEVSLHPSWQSQYIPLLIKILSRVKGCHIIVATHSHLILSDLPLRASTVVSMKKQNSYVYTEILEDDTYGKSAEELLLRVFNTPTSRNYYLSKLVEKALVHIKDRSRETSEYMKIYFEIKKYHEHLSLDDPFRLVMESILELGL